MAISGPTKTVLQTVSVVVLMGGLAWASVPFYDWFCRVTGFGGTPGQVSANSEGILDQTVTVRFDGSLNDGMSWEFKPVVNEMEIRIGETGLAFYEAYNPTDHPIAGQASYNVTPYAAALPSRCLPRASAFKCRSASLLTQKLWQTVTASLYIRSHCLIRFMKLTCQRDTQPSNRTARQT